MDDHINRQLTDLASTDVDNPDTVRVYAKRAQ
jgi:hypothetical protein